MTNLEARKTEYCLDIAVDSSGNAYLVGQTYGGDLDGAGPGPFGNIDGWMAKYSSSGTRLWVKHLGTPENDHAYGVAVDSSNNYYITGKSYGDMDGSGPEVYLGDGDFWVAKYNSSGALVWLKQRGTAQHEAAYEIAVDSSNNVYLTGSTRGDFEGPGAHLGEEDAWVSKFSSDGDMLWKKQLGTPSSPGTSCCEDFSYGVALDVYGNVYITGQTTGDLDGTGPGTSSWRGDAWVAKYDQSNGTFVWSRHIGKVASTETSNGVAVDNAGNVYVVGQSDGNLDGTGPGNFGVSSMGSSLGSRLRRYVTQRPAP